MFDVKDLKFKSDFTIVQIHSPQDKHLIKPLNCNHFIFETIQQGNEWRLDINADEMIENVYHKIYGTIYYPQNEFFDFSKARNLAKSKVKTKYVFQLDADETIIYGTPDRTIQSNYEGYNVKIISDIYDGRCSLTYAKRLFKKEIDYIYPIHEMPNTDNVANSDIIILHTGYINKETILQKAIRNNNLIINSNLAISNKEFREKLYYGLEEEIKLKGEF